MRWNLFFQLTHTADDAKAKHVFQVQEVKWNNITKSCVYLQFKMIHQEASVETIKLTSSLYLVGWAGCNLLWAAQNEWDYHGGSLSTSVDAFESIPKRKTAAKRSETRQSDFVTWQRSASCCKTSENLPENASMGISTPLRLIHLT